MDAKTYLKAAGGIAAVFALFDLKSVCPAIPLFDLKGKNHKTSSSYYFGDSSEETPVTKKMNLWLAYSFSWISCISFVLATKGDSEVIKASLKIATGFSVVGAFLSYYTKMPWTNGVLPACIVFGIADTIYGWAKK